MPWKKPVRWLVLIYTLPAEPTRKRAFVWRELKKLGAVYLRDGACVLPDRAISRLSIQAIVARVRIFDGQATLVEAALIDEVTAQDVVRQARAARDAEYADLVASSGELLTHVRREARHRDFAESETRSLLDDVRKLRRWYDQIRARDYFASAGAAEAAATIAACESIVQGMRTGVAQR